MAYQIESLLIKVATVPSIDFGRPPIGRGTITLGASNITLRYTSIIYIKKTRVLAYSDIDSYYRPFKSILYLRHHNKRIPKIVAVGRLAYDATTVRDIQTIIKTLRAHRIPASKNASVNYKPYFVFGSIAVIFVLVVIFIMFAVTSHSYSQ